MAIRAAKTAAAHGRAPPPAATAKMEPFDLAIALAKVRADEHEESDEARRSGERLATRSAQPTTPAFEITPEDIERIASEFAACDPQATGPPGGDDAVKVPEGRLAVVERPVQEAHVVNATEPGAPSSEPVVAAQAEVVAPKPIEEASPAPVVGELNGAAKVAAADDVAPSDPATSEGSGSNAKFKSSKSGVPKFDPDAIEDPDSEPTPAPADEESSPETSDPSPLVASIPNPQARNVSRSSLIVYLVIVLLLAAAFAGAAMLRR